MTDIYTADRFIVRRDGSHLAAVRGAEPEASRDAQLIAAALNFCEPDAIRQMRTLLGIVRQAVERGRDSLAVAAETHPSDGSDPTPGEPEGGIAGDCEAASLDLTEALHFVDRVLLALPICIPAGSVDEQLAIAAAREASRPARIVVLMEGGLVEQIISDKPVQALVLDHDVEGVDPMRIFHWDDKGAQRRALVSEPAGEVNRSLTINFYAEAEARPTEGEIA